MNRPAVEKQILTNNRKVKERVRKAAIAAAVLITATVLLLILVQRKADKVKEVNALTTKSEELKKKEKELEALLRQYEDKQVVIREIFPNERTVVNFVSEIERIAQLSSSQVEFSFDTDQPKKDAEQYSFLTYTVHIRADINELLVFLDRFERLPYVTVINSIHAQGLGSISGVGDYTIKAIIYVDEAFSV